MFNDGRKISTDALCKEVNFMYHFLRTEGAVVLMCAALGENRILLIAELKEGKSFLMYLV